jgi:hypothetical protein
MHVVVCLIVKLEGRYLKEFCEYYLNRLHFDEVVIYDNNKYNVPMTSLEQNDAVIMKSLASSDKIRVVPWHFPGAQQLRAYNHYFQQHSRKDQWTAYFDADEFLLLKKHATIHQYIQFMQAKDSLLGAIAINWYFFGTSGHKEYSNEDVRKRFTKRQKNVNSHVKCISNHTRTKSICHVHFPELKHNYKILDSYDNVVTKFYNSIDRADIAVIHHYWTMSEDEFRQKCARGNPLHQRKFEEIHQVDDATEEDLSAL